jgi:hypothetical protein
MCDICCGDYNKTSRKEIKCGFCDFACCLACTKKYLLGEGVGGEPHCMSCKHEWTLEFLSEYTPNSFHNQEYREHRVDLLFQREKSLLPEAQPKAEQLLKLKIVEQKMLKELEKLEEQKAPYRKKMQEIDEKMREAREQYYTERAKLRTEPVEKKKFIQACPSNDCNGFLSSSWKCGLCETWVCKNCRCIKAGKDDENHVCNNDLVETIKLLSSDTKNCPNCASAIFKISGCSQMFCTVCHVPFDWNTGKIVKEVIHNPHYYEWQLQNRGAVERNPNDMQCGGIPDFSTIQVHLNRTLRTMEKAKIDSIQKEISQIVRILYHIERVEYRRYPPNIGHLDNEDLRIKFLMKEISEEDWRQELKIQQKKHEKNHAVHQVLEMIVLTASDILRNILVPSNDINQSLQELRNLRTYVNSCLKKVAKRFNNTAPNIDDDWNLIRIK